MFRHYPAGPLSRLYHNARGAHVARSAHLPIRSRLSRRTRICRTPGSTSRDLQGGGTISIGAHCAIGQYLLVSTTNHDTRSLT